MYWEIFILDIIFQGNIFSWIIFMLGIISRVYTYYFPGYFSDIIFLAKFFDYFFLVSY